MKRLVAVPLVTLGLLVWSGLASADHGDFSKPLCADIVDATTGYGLETHVVTSQITTNVASCRGVTYSVVVEVDPGEFLTFSTRGNGTSTQTGRGSVTVTSDAITTDGDDSICVYVMTSRGGPQGTNQLFDRFPDATCTPIVLGGSGGTIGHG